MTESTGNILAIDIGGSHIKGTILDSGGKEQTEYRKLPTPALATPEVVMSTIGDLVKDYLLTTKFRLVFPVTSAMGSYSPLPTWVTNIGKKSIWGSGSATSYINPCG